MKSDDPLCMTKDNFTHFLHVRCGIRVSEALADDLFEHIDDDTNKNVDGAIVEAAHSVFYNNSIGVNVGIIVQIYSTGSSRKQC